MSPVSTNSLVENGPLNLHPSLDTEVALCRRSPFGLFGMIPREIRDMIYAAVLVSNTEVLRTSKALYTEARPLLYKLRICRVYLDYDRVTTTSPSWTFWTASNWHWPSCHCLVRQKPSDDVLAMVQNIALHINLVEPHSNMPSGPFINFAAFENILSSLVGPLEKAKTCHVKITLGSSHELKLRLEPDMDPGMIVALQKLRKFEAVTVELCKRPYSAEFLTGQYWIQLAAVEDDIEAVELIKAQLISTENSSATPKVKIIKSSVSGSPGVQTLWDSGITT